MNTPVPKNMRMLNALQHVSVYAPSSAKSEMLTMMPMWFASCLIGYVTVSSHRAQCVNTHAYNVDTDD